MRETAAELGLPVAVLADLQGPKIRIESFVDEAVEFADGQTFTLDTGLAADAETREQVAIHYEPLLADVKPGSELLINDGAIALTVDSVDARRIVCTVNVGGRLSGRKGVNLRGGGLSASGLTDKDADDIRLAAEMEADYLAVSFVRDASDLHQARRMVEEPAAAPNSAPRSNAPRRSPRSTRSSAPRMRSWSPAATWAWRSATPSCPACRSASSPARGR